MVGVFFNHLLSTYCIVVVQIAIVICLYNLAFSSGPRPLCNRLMASGCCSFYFVSTKLITVTHQKLVKRK